jgi:hypothetical protein
MKQQMKRQKNNLDEMVRKVQKYDDRAVISRLKRDGISAGDYRVELNVYHSEERRGVPYLTMLIHKELPEEKQAELALDLSRIDSGLCVIFKK